jgi:WD40 repeat protein
MNAARAPARVNSRMVIERLAEFHCGRIVRLAVAPHGPYWAASDGRTLQLYCDDVPAMSEPVPGPLADGLRFDHGGTRLLLAPYVFDLQLRCWQPTAQPDPKATPAGHDAMHGAAWSPDGRELVRAMRRLASHRPGAIDASCAPSERLLAAGPAATTLWEGDRTDAIRAIAIDDRHIVAGGAVLSVWERAGHRHVAELEAHRLSACDLAFAPDGALLASVGADGWLAIWQTANWTRAAWCEIAAELSAVAFHPRGPVLATGGADGVLRVHDLAGAVLHQEPLGAPITALAFAPAGNPLMAALGGAEPRVVWLGLA